MSPEAAAGHDAASSARDLLLGGEPLHFQEADQEADRTIQAEWIACAAAAHARIDVRNAIVVGRLELRYAVLEDELTLAGCRIKEPADFSYATFKRNLVLSSTRFEKGVTFHGATLEHDALLDRADVPNGHATFSDVHVKGVCLADWLCIGAGVEAVFNRARFDKTGLFLNSNFGGEASFRGVHFWDQAAFQGATFESAVSFNGAIVGQHALFRSEPAVKIGGARFEGTVDFGGAQIDGQACFQGAVFKKNASFDQVRIAEGLLCGGEPDEERAAATFEGDAVFVDARIHRRADFDGVVFKQKLDFSGSVIEGTASFCGIDKDDLPAAICEGQVSFRRARIAGSVDYRGVLFKKMVTFSLADVGGSAVFSGESQREGRAAVFEAEAHFGSARIRGQADFRGTVFAQGVSFNLTRLEGGAFFRHELAEPARVRPAAVFPGAADFTLCHFGGEADFKGATFKQDVTFVGARFDGAASFEGLPAFSAPAATFDGNVDFTRAHLSRQLELAGVRFNKNATFAMMSVGDSARFTGAVFEGDADFTGAHFGRDASFQEAAFEKQALFNVGRFDGDAFFDGATVKKDGEGDFRGAHFRGVADFHGTIFEAAVDFYAMRGDGLTRFETGVFEKAVSFEEASFVALHFSESGSDAACRQFQGNVDLVGCSYEHIQVDWRSLLAHAEPYDRQPYTQLERVFRAAGRDLEADGVYLERQHRERGLRWQQGELGAWLFSGAYRWVANYGIRPYRLVVAVAVLLIAGTLFFRSSPI